MATGNTRSSSSPSTLRAAARSNPESPTSSAISCSAAAPRSSRCEIRRASATGEASSPTVSRMSAASSSHSGCASASCSQPAPSGRWRRSRWIDSTSENRSTCDGSTRNGSERRRSTASASSGRALEHAGGLEEPPGAARRRRGPRTAAWSSRGTTATGCRSTPRSSSAAESRGEPRGPHPGRGEGESSSASRDGGSATRSRTPSPRNHPPSGFGSALSARPVWPDRMRLSRQRKQRGVISVVTSTTRSSAA